MCRPNLTLSESKLLCRDLRSDVADILLRLRSCEQSNRGVTQQLEAWRATFLMAGNRTAPCQALEASEQMQISPVGGEGSNVMPGQPSRADIRRDAVQSNLLPSLRRDATPHAGSTAGEAPHHTIPIHTLTLQALGEQVQHVQARCCSMLTV